MWDPPRELWTKNWREHSRTELNTVNNCHDFVQAESFERILFPAIRKYIKNKNPSRSGEKKIIEFNVFTFSVPVLQRIFSSVLSIAMRPKLSPEKRAEKLRQVTMMTSESQSGRGFSNVRICNDAFINKYMSDLKSNYLVIW